MKARIAIIFYCLLFGWIGAAPLLAQEFLTQIKHFSVEDGLPNRRCRAIVQDKRGYIWIGTENGLARFDGNNFKVFSQTSSNLTLGRVNEIKIDANDHFWIQSDNNPLIIFDPFTEKSELVSTRFQLPTFDKYQFLPTSLPHSVTFQTNAGWIGHYNGQELSIEYFDLHNPFWNLPRFATSYQTNLVLKENWLIETDSCEFMNCKKSIDKTFIKTQTFLDSTVLIFANKYTSGDSCLFNKKISFYQKGGQLLPFFDTSPGKELKIPNKATDIHHFLYKDSKNRIWVGYNKYLFVFDSYGSLLIDLTNHLSDFYKNPYSPEYIIEDTQHNIWIATGTDGVLCIDLRKNNFTRYCHDEEPAVSVRGITQIADQQVLFNTYQGLMKINPQKQNNSSQILNTFLKAYGIKKWGENEVLFGTHSWSNGIYDLSNQQFGFKAKKINKAITINKITANDGR